ncbi:YgaP family membrane protein [Kaarinaea lacus]
MSTLTQKISTGSILTPNISYESREIRILAGMATIIALMLAAPTPLGLWGLAALVAIPVVASGIIAWDPVHALFGINRYNEAEGEIQQRRWSCPNVGTVDRVARLGIGILLLATAFTSSEIVWQSITALLAIPVIMSAIMAWDPLYALAYTNTFASKSDVQSADPELEDSTLAKFYRFPSVKPDNMESLDRAA